ncbi:uncharacterized protein COLE_04790 [Cutaneotrichosporon oleaginosum]|nr:hypothetical protein COLE_04790 [Cutaneotrichosporon oleaginosum]
MGRKPTPNGSSALNAVNGLSNGERKNASASNSTKPESTSQPLGPPDIVVAWPSDLKANVAAGLVNMSMACYSNAIIQMLMHTPPVLRHFHQHSPGNCENKFCVTCSLRETALEHWSGKRSVYRPQAIHGNLGRIKKGFSVKKQEDAHEFLRFVTDAMQNSELQNSGIAGLPSVELEKYKRLSWVNRALGGRVRSRVLCLTCKKPSDTFDSVLDLSLDIPSHARTLLQLLDHFVHTEKLDGENKYKCDNCKKKVVATKQMMLDKAPPVLTLHLKRFGYNWRGSARKINTTIVYPTILDLKPYLGEALYRLYGVVCHRGGGPDSGHYTAWVRGPERTSWFRADDEEVRRVSPKDALNDAGAYLLNYVRLTPEEIALWNARKVARTDAAVAPEAPTPHSPGKRRRDDDDTSEPHKRPTPATKTVPVYLVPKVKSTNLQVSSVGKRKSRDEDEGEESPSPHKRPSTPSRNDALHEYASGVPNGGLARLANYGSSDDGRDEDDGEASPYPGPMPGSYPTSPRSQASEASSSPPANRKDIESPESRAAPPTPSPKVEPKQERPAPRYSGPSGDNAFAKRNGASAEKGSKSSPSALRKRLSTETTSRLPDGRILPLVGVIPSERERFLGRSKGFTIRMQGRKD